MNVVNSILHPRTFETARLPFRIFEVLTDNHLEQNVLRSVLNVHRFIFDEHT